MMPVDKSVICTNAYQLDNIDNVYVDIDKGISEVPATLKPLYPTAEKLQEALLQMMEKELAEARKDDYI